MTPSTRRWLLTTTALVASAGTGAALATLRARLRPPPALAPSVAVPATPPATAAPPVPLVPPSVLAPPSLLSARPSAAARPDASGRTYLYAAVVPPAAAAPVRTQPDEDPARSALGTTARAAGKLGLVALVLVGGVLVPTGPSPEPQQLARSWPVQAIRGSAAGLELTTDATVSAPALALAAVQQPVAPGTPAAGLTTSYGGGSLAPIPSMVLAAYHAAAQEVNAADPECRLSWSVLAGIGALESRHGASGGSLRAGWSGVASPPILGPVLDGSRRGMARISDTDRGRYDGDSAYDRAVGPMQFLPGTWVAYGLDAAGNGDPQNIRDAARAAGRYLCAGAGDLADPAQLAPAVYRYNRADWYVRAVLAGASGYLAASYGPGPEGVAMAAIAFAYARLGDPYLWGGTGPLFDCSGLTQAAFRSAGVSLPRTAAQQWRSLPAVPPGDLRPGDLLFSDFGAREAGMPGHVGIYVGAGKMVAAPSTGQFIRIQAVPSGADVRRPAALAVGSDAPLPGTGFAITLPGAVLPAVGPTGAPVDGAPTAGTPATAPLPGTAPVPVGGGTPATAPPTTTAPGTAPPRTAAPGTWPGDWRSTRPGATTGTPPETPPGTAPPDAVVTSPGTPPPLEQPPAPATEPDASVPVVPDAEPAAGEVSAPASGAVDDASPPAPPPAD